MVRKQERLHGEYIMNETWNPTQSRNKATRDSLAMKTLAVIKGDVDVKFLKKETFEGRDMLKAGLHAFEKKE